MRPTRRFGTVIFDVDATLSQIEGIEELGREHRAEIEELTDAAMGGHVPLQDIYGRRLALARPHRSRVLEVGRMYVERITADAKDVVATLQAHGIDVRIASSGVLPAVRILAEELGIPEEKVAAPDLVFDEQGNYNGFDTASPLTASHGKLRVVERWLDQLRRPIMMVGDGATDLETKGLVDLFVAFAGVAQRPAVMAAADVVIRQASLAPVLPLALEIQPETEPARSVYQRGLSMLQPYPVE